MFRALYSSVVFRAPMSPRMTAAQRKAAAHVWEAVRITEKDGNYCIPTPAGFELCFDGELQRITGDTAENVRRSSPAGVDPADWILYIYTLEG